MKSFPQKKQWTHALALALAVTFVLAASEAQAACPYACSDLATATGNIDTTGNTLTNDINAGSTYNAIISGNGNSGASLIVTDTGATANVWQLGGVNTFTGTADIQNHASVQFTVNGVMNQSSGVTVETGGALDISATSQTLHALSGGGNITTSTGAVLTENGTAAYSGVISGGGVVAIAGSGNWTLSGVNTYTGVTNVLNGATLTLSGTNDIATSSSVEDNGTIAIGTTSQTLKNLQGSGSVTTGANGLITENGTSTWAGVISGAGGVTTAGTGTWTVTGTNTYTGATTVGSGTTLKDNGTISSSTGGLTVNGGGTLQGTGTVTGAVTNNGHVAPGNSIGTLTVGTFTQGANGTFDVEFNDSASDKLVVTTGAATLDGAVNYIPLTPATKYVRGTTYTVIDNSTGTGVSGSFAKAADGTAMPADNIVTSDNDPAILASSDPALAIETLYGANAVTARIERAEFFEDSGVTPNEKAAGAALDTLQLITPDGSDMDTLLNNISADSTVDQATDLNHLTGELNADLQTGFRDSLRAFDGMLGKRLGGDCNSMNDSPVPGYGMTSMRANYYQPGQSYYQPSYYDEAPSRHVRSAWACGYGQFGTIDSDGNAGETKSTIAGGAFGMEFQPDSHALLRVGIGYANDAVGIDTTSDSASLNSYQAGVYGQYTLNHAYLGGSLAGAYDTGQTTRHVIVGGLNRTASASPDGYSFAASGTLGYAMQLRRLNVDIAASAEYIYTKQNAFDETGAGAADLSVDEKTVNSLRGTLGAQVSTTLPIGRRGMTLTPEARIAVIEDALTVRPSASETFTGTAASFTVNGANPGRIGMQGGGGFTLGVSRRLSLFADYNGTFKEHETDHEVLGGMKLSW